MVLPVQGATRECAPGSDRYPTKEADQSGCDVVVVAGDLITRAERGVARLKARFHETKNNISGEGGSLLVNDPDLVLRAEIMREKGTDRRRFFRGEVDKYTWQDVGSSFLPSDITAAFLWAQFEEAQRITDERVMIWQRYHDMIEPLEQQGLLRRPVVPADCQHNGHLYYILLAPQIDRQIVLDELKSHGIGAVFLCAAPFIAGRDALGTRAGRPFADDIAVATSDTVADVAGLERSTTTEGLRRIGCNPEEITATNACRRRA